MKILFLCTENTCRSKMAEAIFNKLYSNNETAAYSAGIMAVSGTKTSKNAAIVVRENLDVDISENFAHSIDEDMIKGSGLILAMTESIENSAGLSFPEYSHKIYSLNRYVGLESDISDPFGGNLDTYKQIYNEIYNSILLLYNKLKKDNCI